MDDVVVDDCPVDDKKERKVSKSRRRELKRDIPVWQKWWPGGNLASQFCERQAGGTSGQEGTSQLNTRSSDEDNDQHECKRDDQHESSTDDDDSYMEYSVHNMPKGIFDSYNKQNVSPLGIVRFDRLRERRRRRGKRQE